MLPHLCAAHPPVALGLCEVCKVGAKAVTVIFSFRKLQLNRCIRNLIFYLVCHYENLCWDTTTRAVIADEEGL